MIDQHSEVVQEILGEIAAMREVGMNVPVGAEAYVRANAAEMQDYRDGGMKYAEIADLVCLVA